MKSKIKQWTNSENVGRTISSGSNDSILAALFQKILSDLNLKMHNFNILMERYLEDPRNCVPTNIKERSSARGNIRKELMKSVMTWKVFCKGIRFLNVKRFRLSIQLHHVNGNITEHSCMINTGELAMGEEIEKENNGNTESDN